MPGPPSPSRGQLPCRSRSASSASGRTSGIPSATLLSRRIRGSAPGDDRWPHADVRPARRSRRPGARVPGRVMCRVGRWWVGRLRPGTAPPDLSRSCGLRPCGCSPPLGRPRRADFDRTGVRSGRMGFAVSHEGGCGADHEDLLGRGWHAAVVWMPGVLMYVKDKGGIFEALAGFWGCFGGERRRRRCPRPRSMFRQRARRLQGPSTGAPGSRRS